MTFVRLVVIALVLWTNLNLSVGQDNISNSTDGIESEDDLTEELVNWDQELLVIVRWNIEEPVVEYENLRFDINFPVSDYIQAQKHVRYDIYQNPECGKPEDLITDRDGYMESWVTEDDTPVGPGIGQKRIITVSNQLNAQTIAQSKSYTEVESGGGRMSSIAYCVRFSLWNGEGPSDPEASEINHLTVNIRLSLDLDDNFSITGQKVESKDRDVETSSDEFFVDAFWCDASGNPLTLVNPLQQGDSVKVCIQPTQQAMEVGFRIQRIEKFIFEQGMTSQGVIANGEASPNQLTQLSCVEGAIQCSFETLLFASFYENISEGTVVGSGQATLQWGGEGVDRRNLQEENLKTERKMIEEIQNWRSLQRRSSQKSIELPPIAILADDGTVRPPLKPAVQSTSKKQVVIVIAVLFMFGAVLILPLVCEKRFRQWKTDWGDESETSDPIIPLGSEAFPGASTKTILLQRATMKRKMKQKLISKTNDETDEDDENDDSDDDDGGDVNNDNADDDDDDDNDDAGGYKKEADKKNVKKSQGLLSIIPEDRTIISRKATQLTS